MKILILKLVDVLKRNLIEEIESLRDVVVSNDPLPFSIPVLLTIGVYLTCRGRAWIYSSYASSTTLWLWASLFHGRQWCHDGWRNLRRSTWRHQVIFAWRSKLILERRLCKIGFCILLFVVQLPENFAHFYLNIPMKSANQSTVLELIISANEISKV